MQYTMNEYFITSAISNCICDFKSHEILKI